MKTEIAAVLEADARLTESALKEYYEKADKCVFITDVLKKSQLYSLLSGGKRIRPAIVIEVCRALGGKTEAALPFACALEMIHTYSLIHDDLPCMDNAETRRGKPSNHRVFGEANATLAGDGLLTDAFAVCADNPLVPSELRVEAVIALSAAAGSRGMVRGQTSDLFGEGQRLDREQFFQMISDKTGALIRCACTLGCLAAGKPSDSRISRTVTEVYGGAIGKVFQIIDDILDVTSTKENTGKDTHHDAQSDKTTTLSFMTVEEAEAEAKRLTETAIEGLASVGVQSEILTWLAEFLLTRRN